MFISFIEKLLSRIVRDNNKLQSVLRDISFILFYHQPSSSSFPFNLQFSSSFPGLLYVMYTYEALNENYLCHILLLNGMSTVKIKILSNKCFLFSVLYVFACVCITSFTNCICVLLSLQGLRVVWDKGEKTISTSSSPSTRASLFAHWGKNMHLCTRQKPMFIWQKTNLPNVITTSKGI